MASDQHWVHLRVNMKPLELFLDFFKPMSALESVMTAALLECMYIWLRFLGIGFPQLPLSYSITFLFVLVHSFPTALPLDLII